jgi:type IV pilus assembly protein PilC
MHLIAASSNQSQQSWLGDIQNQLKKGLRLSQCLEAMSNTFSSEFISLIRVSERTGDMTLALQTICQQLEAQIELKRKIQQALIYPMVTLCSSVMLVAVMMVWVIPVFKDVFGHFQADLPVPTKILIEISSAMSAHFLGVVICMVGSSFFFLFAWRQSSGLQKKIDRLTLRIPVIGNLLRLAALTHWCRILGHLLDSGLPLPEALRVTAQSSNHWLSHDLSAEIFKHLTRGWPLGEALKKADPNRCLFDYETLQLLHIAAESGFLPQMLSKRAASLGSLLSDRLHQLGQTVEPLLIMVVGVIIGGIVITLYLPIFHLGQVV